MDATENILDVQEKINSGENEGGRRVFASGTVVSLSGRGLAGDRVARQSHVDPLR